VEYGDGICTLYAANLGVDRDEGLNLGPTTTKGMITRRLPLRGRQVCKTGWQSSFAGAVDLQTRPDLVEEATQGQWTKSGFRPDQEIPYHVPVGLVTIPAQVGEVHRATGYPS